MTALIGNPLLLTSAPAADGDAYQIEKSLRFNTADNPSLSRTIGSSGNRRVWTFSCWAKRCSTGSVHRIMSSGADSDNYFLLEFSDDDYIKILSKSGGSNVLRAYTSGVGAKYRDPSAWYHIVLAVDTNQPWTTGRCILYVNGSLVPLTFDTSPAQYLETEWLDPANTHKIGQNGWDAAGDYDGLISNVEFIDGLQLSPAAFGAYDKNTNVWNPKAFALGTPNTTAESPTWSGMCSGTVFGSAQAYTKAFDGNPLTQCHSQNGGEIVFTPTGGLDFNHFALGYTYCTDYGTGTIYCKVNDINIIEDLRASSCSDGYYDTVDLRGKYGIEKINTIKWTRQSDGDLLLIDRIFIDGVVLIDGKGDAETLFNPNNGTKWSTYGTFTNYANVANAFDGKVAYWSTSHTAPTMATGSANSAWTWDLGSDNKITGVDTITLHIWPSSNQSGSNLVKINDTDVSAQCLAHGERWVAVEIDDFTEFQKLEIANNYWYLAGISINGHLLIDGTVDNSYRLKLNETSRLGKDTLRGKLDDSNKGLPIYKTTDDWGEVRDGTAIRADSFKSTLVLAVPFVGSIADISNHADLRNSGSAISLTVAQSGSGSTPVLSTDESKFYGTSGKWAGGNYSNGGYIDFSLTNGLGDGDFTIEYWAWETDFYNYKSHISSDRTNNNGFNVGTDGTRNFIWADNQGSGITRRIDVVGAVPGNKWNHWAFCRSGSTIRGFLNGAFMGKHTSSFDYSDANFSIGRMHQSGGGSGHLEYHNGYLQDMKIYRGSGSAKYTTDAWFTPPVRNDLMANNLTGSTGTITPSGAATGGLPILNVTTSAGTAYSSPVSAATDGISNKQLYLPFQGANGGSTFTDYSGNNRTPDDVTGTPSTSTGSSKFGGVSGYFDGTTDYLKWDQAAWQISANTTDWTVEFWFRWDSGSSGARGICGMLGNGGNNQSWFVALDSNHKIKTEMYLGGSWRNITCDNAISADTWTHVSCCVHGGTYTMYINGTAQSTTVSSISGTTSLPTNAEPFYIGTLGHNNYSEFKGYIQDFRLVDDGLHTGNFTVPGTVPYFIPVTDLDSLTDTPTNYGEDSSPPTGGEVRGNFCTMNPLSSILTDSSTITEGNLKVTGTISNSNNAYFFGTMGIKSSDTDGYYYEVTQEVYQAGGGVGFLDGGAHIGAINTQYGLGATEAANSDKGVTIFNENNYVNYYGTATANATTDWTSNGDVVGVAVKNNKIWIHINGTYHNSGNPVTEANPTITLSGEKTLIPMIMAIGNGTRPVLHFNGGQRAFKHTAPTGFKTYCTQNFDDTFDNETTENNPSKYMDILTYEGTGTTAQSVLGLKFQPDLVWIKNRDGSNAHHLYDAIRGKTSRIFPNTQDEANTSAPNIFDFKSTGIEVDEDVSDGTNDEDKSFVAWVWDCGTAAATASTDGSITPDAQWVNATAGFSITKYTGNNTNSTVGHGLNAAPDFMIHKDYSDGATDWQAWHSYLNGTKSFQLSQSAGSFTQADMWNNTAPTNTVFHLGTGNGTNRNGEQIMMYCWTAIDGYSAFGSYTGNNSATAGPFVYTGFRPRWILSKEDGTGGWKIWDTKRNPYNPNQNPLWANLTNDETGAGAGYRYDIFSNGFQVLGTSGHANNDDGDKYIYAAFAEHPFKIARAK